MSDVRFDPPLDERLQLILARTYAEPAQMAELATRMAGIPPSVLPANKSPMITWGAVLKFTEAAGQTDTLVRAVLRDGKVAPEYRRHLLQLLEAQPPMGQPSAPLAAASPPASLRSPLIFLCHSSGDKEEVRRLHLRLRADGLRCWFDEADLRPGQDWDYEIRRAMRRSSHVLVCVSKTSVSRAGYVQKELARALDLADEQPEGTTFLIPVRLEDCVIPDRLGRWHWVDLFTEGGYQRLVWSINHETTGRFTAS